MGGEMRQQQRVPYLFKLGLRARLRVLDKALCGFHGWALSDLKRQSLQGILLGCHNFTNGSSTAKLVFV